VRNLKSVAVAIDAHLQRLNNEIAQLENGEVRHAYRHRGGFWQDRTEEAIHSKRNLVATFEALRRTIRQFEQDDL
jgi:hypothetical protein